MYRHQDAGPVVYYFLVIVFLKDAAEKCTAMLFAREP